jgi:hypothetical protein
MATVRELVRTANSSDHHLGLALLGFVLVSAVFWLLARGPLGRLCGLGAAVSLVAAAEATLARPGPSLFAQPELFRRSCEVTNPWAWSTEGLLNLALLAPFCFLAVLAVGHPILVSLTGIAASLGFETFQWFTARGICDSSDVVHNAMGAIAAAVVAGVLRRWWRWARSAVLAPSQVWSSSC